MAEEKVDIGVLMDTVQRWAKLGYTEQETEDFIDAVMTNLPERLSGSFHRSWSFGKSENIFPEGVLED